MKYKSLRGASGFDPGRPFLVAPTLRLSGGLGWVSLSVRLPDPTAVCRKSFIFSSLPIRKGLILGFWFPVDFVHRLVAPTTCSDYLFFTTCIGLSETAKNRGGESIGNSVENSPDSHKPVEIGNLGSQGDSKIWGVSPTDAEDQSVPVVSISVGDAEQKAHRLQATDQMDVVRRRQFARLVGES